ncbi:putative alanine--glyoxylate transaminase [Helianthus annuus]|nr:putative alanine--glyoxylate transaminase [Helianthus annuus]
MKGLILGVELVTNRKSKTPASAEVLEVMDNMKDLGVLIGKGGFYGNVFRITHHSASTNKMQIFLSMLWDYSMSKL